MKLDSGKAHPRRKWSGPRDPATARFRRAQEAAETIGGVRPIKIRPPASRVAHPSTADEIDAHDGPQAPTVAQKGEDTP